MSPKTLTLAFVMLAAALCGTAFAHGTGEAHQHAHTWAWLDYAGALLAIGLCSAYTARRAGRAGRDRALQLGATWVTRACSLGIVLCVLVAAL